MSTLEAYRSLPFVDPQEVAKNLARLVAESGMTQTEIASQSGLKQEAISRAIRKGIGLSHKSWRKLAVVLGVPVEHIFGLQRLDPEKNFA